MTCKDCFHCKACDLIYESCTHESVEGLEFPDGAELCEHFKHSDNVVEVVRCKDCKHFDNDMPYCTWHYTGSSPDDFCSYGERRTE